MSDIVEKTLASLPKMLSGSMLGVAPQASSPKHSPTRGFHAFLRNINRAKSKQEEEVIVRNELKEMNQLVPGSKSARVSDCLCCAIYCQMIGYNMSKLAIHAVTLAQQGKAVDKRLGYLACTLLLTPKDELILLLVNTLQKDLQSSNFLDNCAALTTIGHLIDAEHIPSLLPLVKAKLHHTREIVRMKAAACICVFLQKLPPLTPDFHEEFRQILFDKDPGVMSIGVNICSYLVQKGEIDEPAKQASSLVYILQQVIQHKLPQQFDFHGVPLPWLQIKILKLLAVLGEKNKVVSEGIYPVIQELLERINLREGASYAVLYECIMTISKLHPNVFLLKQAVIGCGRFLKSTNSVLQYVGLQCLTSLMKTYPQAAEEFQMNIVELLDDPDSTVQMKALKFIVQIANQSNVKVICDRLLSQVGKQQNNQFLASELVSMVMELADKYKENYHWYGSIVFNLLTSCPAAIPESYVQKVIVVIEQGLRSLKDTEAEEYCTMLLHQAKEALGNKMTSKSLCQLSLWILGEVTPSKKDVDVMGVVSLVLSHVGETDKTGIKSWAVAALLKLASAGVLRGVENMREKLTRCMERQPEIHVRQMLRIIINMLELSSPIVQSAEPNTPMDLTFTFLDDHVTSALERGCKPYVPQVVRQNRKAAHFMESTPDKLSAPASSVDGTSNTSTVESPSSKNTSNTPSGLKVKHRVWGKEGLLTPDLPAQQSHDDTLADEKARKLDLAKSLFGSTIGGAGLQQKHSLPLATNWGWDSDSAHSGDTGQSEGLYAGDEESTHFTDNKLLKEAGTPQVTDKGWRSLHQQLQGERTEVTFPENRQECEKNILFSRSPQGQGEEGDPGESPGIPYDSMTITGSNDFNLYSDMDNQGSSASTESPDVVNQSQGHEPSKSQGHFSYKESNEISGSLYSDFDTE